MFTRYILFLTCLFAAYYIYKNILKPNRELTITNKPMQQKKIIETPDEQRNNVRFNNTVDVRKITMNNDEEDEDTQIPSFDEMSGTVENSLMDFDVFSNV